MANEETFEEQIDPESPSSLKARLKKPLLFMLLVLMLGTVVYRLNEGRKGKELCETFDERASALEAALDFQPSSDPRSLDEHEEVLTQLGSALKDARRQYVYFEEVAPRSIKDDLDVIIDDLALDTDDPANGRPSHDKEVSDANEAFYGYIENKCGFEV